MAQLMASFEDEFVPGESNGWREGDAPVVVKPKFGVTWMVDNEVVRLDLETFKWCPPSGDGRHDDLHLLYEVWQDKGNWLSFCKKLTITAPNCVDGFYRRKVDATSGFRYEYQAATNEVYEKTIVYNVDRRGGKPDVVELPRDDEFFTFRMRTATNETGKVVQAHYGRIGERSGHMFGLRMKTWFSTKPNDTNLEDARLR